MNDEIEDRFRSRPNYPQRDILHGRIRAAAREFAELVTILVGGGRERSLSLTHIEEAMMWANLGIARTFIPEGGE